MHLATRSARTLFAAVTFVAALAACRSGEKPAEGAVSHYTVRGEVVRTSDGAAGRELWIRHEAIPDFVDRNGARVGMHAMTMPFHTGPAATTPVKPGDKIRFTFTVDFGRNAFQIDAIDVLPPDTALEFGKP